METVKQKGVKSDTIGVRLKSERQKMLCNQTDFAALGGASKPTQIRYEKGERFPDGNYLALIAEAGADVQYILTGNRSTPINPPSAPDLSADLIYLPEYEIHASAGLGQTPATERIVRDIGFKAQFLRDLGATPNQCSVIRADGDSMHPTIPDGSLLVIDHSQASLHDGCIYVLGVADDLLVKRVRRMLDGSIDLISDNQKYYPVQSLAADRLSDLRIVGRVVYFCRVP